MKKKLSIARSAVFLAMVAFSITFLYPIFFMLINALKTKKEYFISQFALPADFLNFTNFRSIIFDFHILSNFRSSLIVAGGATILLVLFAVFASYAFAKLDFRGKKAVYVAILATMFLPGQVSMIPAYVMFSKLHLMNSYWSVILSYLASGLPAAILLMTNGFMGISNEMIESAKIDGAGYFSIVRNVIVPMGMPAVAICLIFNIVGYWKIGRAHV
jgi:ABC-type glycerol-3-phosphate transport system permease component